MPKVRLLSQVLVYSSRVRLKSFKRRGGFVSPKRTGSVSRSRQVRIISVSLALIAIFATYITLTPRSETDASAATQIVVDRFTGPTNGVSEATSNNWSVSGNTAATNQSLPAMVDGPDAGTAVDRLRLTNTASQSQTGYALYNVGQTTNAGLDIKFNVSMHGSGGNGCPWNPADNYNAISTGGSNQSSNCQADGFVFFLKRGTNNDVGGASLGSAGGSLGYSPISSNSSINGLSGALLGIGLDAYGNFYQQPYGGTGCTADPAQSTSQFARRSLIVRGPSTTSRQAGYCRIETSNREIVSSRDEGVNIASTGVFTQAGSAMRILLDPTDTDGDTKPRGTGRIYLTTPAASINWSNVTETAKFELPQALLDSDTFKFGFVGGTGGGVMNTEIWATSVSSVADIADPTWVTPASQCTVVNSSAALTFEMREGVAPFSYSLQSGSLPAGMSLGSTGFTGTPTTSGVFTFVIRATDGRASPVTVDQTFTYRVAPTSCTVPLISSCEGAGFLQNGSFESVTSDAPDSWRTTATDGAYEVWSGVPENPSSTASIGTPADAYSHAGNRIAELQANNSGGSNQGLYQDVATIPGSVIRWSYWHHHRTGINNNAQVSKVVIGAAPAGIPAGSVWTSTEQGNPFNGATTTEVSHSATWNGGWMQSTASYVVPAGQTTTRFLFASVTTPANGYGNLLDDISFTPTMACPMEVTIVQNRARSVTLSNNSQDSENSTYFGPSGTTVANQTVPSELTSVITNGSSNTTMRLESSTVGDFTLRYRVTDQWGEQSDANITVHVVPEASARVPAILPVDPSANSHSLPSMTLTGPTNAYMCVEQVANVGGDAIATPTLTIDETLAVSGVTTTSSGNTRIYSGTAASVQDQFDRIRVTRNSSSVLSNSSAFLRLRVSSIDDGENGSCTNGISRIIELRPFDRENKSQFPVDVN